MPCPHWTQHACASKNVEIASLDQPGRRATGGGTWAGPNLLGSLLGSLTHHASIMTLRTAILLGAVAASVAAMNSAMFNDVEAAHDPLVTDGSRVG